MLQPVVRQDRTPSTYQHILRLDGSEVSQSLAKESKCLTTISLSSIFFELTQRCRSTASFKFAAATLFSSLAATAGPTTARFSVSSPTSRLLQNHGFRIRGCTCAVQLWTRLVVSEHPRRLRDQENSGLMNTVYVVVRLAKIDRILSRKVTNKFQARLYYIRLRFSHYYQSNQAK